MRKKIDTNVTKRLQLLLKQRPKKITNSAL